MNESRESKNAEQLEELLLLTEEIQEELEQKEQLIVELKTQLSESLTLNEKLNKENRAGNIQALKNDLKLADRALRIEKEKLRSANAMIEECQDKICYLTQERDYARTHQKIVEIPVEKPVLYEKCEACNRTAYQNAKAKYETQKERLAGQYKAKTVMFQTTLFLLAWELERQCFPPEEAAEKDSFEKRLTVFPNHFWLLEDSGKLASMINGMTTDIPILRDEMFEDATMHREEGQWQMIFGVATLPEYQPRSSTSISYR